MSNWFERLDAKVDGDIIIGAFWYAVLLIGLTLLLWGCAKSEPMPPIITNAQVIAETQFCEAAGLNAETWTLIDDRGKRGITRVTCVPRRQCKP